MGGCRSHCYGGGQNTGVVTVLFIKIKVFLECVIFDSKK